MHRGAYLSSTATCWVELNTASVQNPLESATSRAFYVRYWIRTSENSSSRTFVHKGKKTGRGYYAPALEYAVRRYPLEGLTNR
jgi:hypothetical protein